MGTARGLSRLASSISAQFFFAGRTLLQWLYSEKKNRVTSPTAFWGLSLIGSLLMFIYGVFRDDFSIVLGQVVSYSIYLWNLDVKGTWKRVPLAIRGVLLVIPVLAVAFLLKDARAFVDNMLRNESIPLWLVLFGTAGQLLFTLRFVYQWLYSRRRGESLLPKGFWLISLAGALVILVYGIIRKDPVLIIAHSFGILVYVRNLMLGYFTAALKACSICMGDVVMIISAPSLAAASTALSNSSSVGRQSDAKVLIIPGYFASSSSRPFSCPLIHLDFAISPL